MKNSIGKCLRIYLLLWFQSDIYPCIFAESKQKVKTTCPANLKPFNVESPSNCSFSLFNDSNNFEYALSRLKWEDGHVQRIITDIQINKHDTRRESSQSILPNKWLLAYIDPNGPYYFVSWSSDFKVLSLGLLSDDNNEQITVKINETSGHCVVVEGENYMISEIVKLFTGFIQKKLDLDKQYDYENIYLCYLSKFKWFEDSRWYLAKRLLGIPFQEFGYKCCMVREQTVCCDDKLHRIEGYRLLPYIISIVLVLFFPICLMSIANCFRGEDNMISIRRENSTSNIELSLMSESGFLRFPIFHGLCDDQDISEQRRDALGVLRYTCYSDYCSCDCSWSCPSLSKRWKRCVFVLFFPSIIYIEFILLMSFGWQELLNKIGKDNLLFGFPSMLGSIKNTMFLPPEGPMGALIIYHILGFFIIVLPDDFETLVLEKGIFEGLANAVNMLEPNGFRNEPGRGYYKIRQILGTFMYLPLNAVYYITGKGFITKVCRFVFSFMFIFPIIPFSVIALVGWVLFIYSQLDSRCNWDRCYSWILKIFKGFICIIFFLAFMIFYGISVVILSYSICLLLYIVFFTILAFIVAPTLKSKLIFCLFGGFVFLCQIIRDSIRLYEDFLHLIIDICENDDNLKARCMISTNQGQFIDKKLVIVVFRKIRPAFVEIGQLFLKTFLIIIMYVSSFLFMIYFDNAIERLSILITSITPFILQWKLKTVCPERTNVETKIRDYAEPIVSD